MTTECLLDTNVLVYAVSSTSGDERKQSVALTLIRERSFALSAQVLQEFYVTVTRKLRAPLQPDVAASLVDQYRAFPIVATDDALVMAAIEISVRHRVSYWDAAILAAAMVVEAPIVFSEDLAHEQHYGPVQVLNPFLRDH